MLPQVNFLSFETRRCIITRTPSKYPMIDQLSERLFVATGGNGSSAKCADTWGRLAAGLVHNGRWLQNIPREPFRAVFL
jgi:glycine/D-amino acid oxidase-like deaminating enzyme